MSNVSLTQTSKYVFSNNNNLITFYIDPATIKSVSENIIVHPGEDATVSCTAEGNPLNEDTITWRRDNYQDFDAKTMITYDKNGTSYLRIGSVTREDLGYFQCIVNNGIGNQTLKDVLLIVKRKFLNNIL